MESKKLKPESAIEQDNMQAVDAAAATLRARTLELQKKTIEMAQANMNATFEFFRRALVVKEPADFFALNQEFARDQFATFSKQASELSELSLALVKETSQPVREGLMRSFGDLSNRTAA